MEQYSRVSQLAAELITKSYSTSFSNATRLFSPAVRPHIYNIYGLVRVADEIVDSYDGPDAAAVLDHLETDVYRALRTGYSANIIVQAFAETARKFDIGQDLIKPFFASMRTDITQKTFTKKQYEDYIYGSAEVVGLMCLKVFCPKRADYAKLAPGAQALGAAFQKVNFLRDFADDALRLGRCYFPGTTYDSFDAISQSKIIAEIRADFKQAEAATAKLPASAQPAVKLAFNYYSSLLKKLAKASPEEIKTQRFRVPDGYKVYLLARAWGSKQRRRGKL